MKSFLGLVTVIFLSSACGQKTSEIHSKAMTDSTKQEVLRYAILKDTTKVSQWTPSDDQIHLVESLLKRAIKDNESKDNKRLKKDSLYAFYRQYTCYVENGDSIIFVNAFCSMLEERQYLNNGEISRKRFDWQNQLLKVKDGGDCYWQSVINFSKKNIKAFVVNGRA